MLTPAPPPKSNLVEERAGPSKQRTLEVAMIKMKRDEFKHGCGYLVLRRDVEYIDAHCIICGAKRDTSTHAYRGCIGGSPAPKGRSSTIGRPMGRQLLFLKQCLGQHLLETEEEHSVEALKTVKKTMQKLHASIVDQWRQLPDKAYEERVAERVKVQTNPAYYDFFDAEDSGLHRKRVCCRTEETSASFKVVNADGPEGEPFDCQTAV